VGVFPIGWVLQKCFQRPDFNASRNSTNLLGALEFCEKWLLALSCPSVRPRRTTRIPLEGFWWNYIFEVFFRKSAKLVQVLLKSDKNNGYFTWRRFHIYDNILLNKISLDKIKTHILCSTTFFRKSCRLLDNVKNFGGGKRGHKRRHNMEYMRCILDKQGYMHARTCTRPRARA
jgi:hypothetical protein